MPGIVYIKAGLAERHRCRDLNMLALSLCVDEIFQMSMLPSKPRLERYKKGGGRLVTISESSNSWAGDRGSYLHYRKNKAETLPVRCLLFF